MTTTARPAQMDPVTTTAYSRQRILRNRYPRWRIGRPQLNSVPIPGYHEENSKSYRRRIDTLLGYASEEGIDVRDESKRDFDFFVDTVIPTDKAMLIVMDNGNLRATWREDHNRLSLEFVGGRAVHYVVFIPADPNGQPLEDSGERSFDEVPRPRQMLGIMEYGGLMTCGNVPDHDHVTHYVRPSKVLDDDSIDGSVFRESALDDDGISVNWLEYFADKNESERLRAVALSIQQETRTNGRFAEINVGEIVECLDARNGPGRVKHDPQEARNGHGPDPSHCLIQGLPTPGSEENKRAADAIADCVRAVHPATRTKTTFA